MHRSACPLLSLRAFLAATLAPLVLVHGVAELRAEDAVTVEIAIKEQQFDPMELTVPANKTFVLKVKNLDGAAAEFESKAMRVEKVVAAKSEAIINVRALAPGRYGFFNEFHPDTKGVLVAK
jgi:hypothetical protein